MLAYNADGARAGAKARMAYIGQALYESGFAMGQRIVELVPKGDVAIFIATPGALNIQPRIDGAIAAIKQSGKPIKPKIVATEPDLSKELTAIDSYYLGHKNLPGMFAVDAGDTQGVGQIIQKHSLPGKVIGGGYDLLPGTLKLIQNGSLNFTIDQQPYLQGFYPVIQLFLYKLSGGLVAPSDTNTGLLFVTKDNVKPYLTTKTRYQELSAQKYPVSGNTWPWRKRRERTGRRAGLGWRVAGASFAAARRASSSSRSLSALLLGRERGVLLERQHQEHHRVDGPDRADRGRRGDAAHLRRDRPRGRAGLRARAGDRLVVALRPSTTSRSGSGWSWRSSSLRRRAHERRDHDLPPRPVVHHDARHALLPQRHHAAPDRGLAAVHARRRTFQKIFGSQPDQYTLYLNSEFFWALGLVLVLQVMLTWTRWGLHTFATGGNLVGAAESGVNVRRIKIGNFVLANVLAGFAGILDSTRVTTIVPLQGGPDLMFLAVAGAVIGGTSLFGGSAR